jgi:hypothetical protein
MKMENKQGNFRKAITLLSIFSLLLIGTVIAAQVGPKNLWVAISIGNSPMTIFNASVSMVSPLTLIEGVETDITVYFNITNPDGNADVNNATIKVNVSYNGMMRVNNTGNCINLGDPSVTTRAYACKIAFKYYDNATNLWDINVSATDAGGVVAYNDSWRRGNNLTINSLSAFALQTASVATQASLGDSDKELSVIINNTGNFDFTLLNVTPFDLNATVTDFFRLNGNFSINATKSLGGYGDNLMNGTPRNFTASQNQLSATMPHKIVNESDTLGNRTLYIYVDIPLNKGLSTGVTYNSSPSMPWQLFAS